MSSSVSLETDDGTLIYVDLERCLGVSDDEARAIARDPAQAKMLKTCLERIGRALRDMPKGFRC